MKRLETLAAIAVLLALATTACADWQYARDFSANQNDSSVAWQRGYLTGPEGTFCLYDAHEVAVADTLVGWHDAAIGWDPYGNAIKNISNSDYDAPWGIYYPAGQATVTSGASLVWNAVRWIAPTAGYYNVLANWTNQKTNGMDVTVGMRNTTNSLEFLPNSTATLTEFVGANASVAAGKFSYSNTLYFDAGQPLDFVVESTAYWASQTAGLDARITAVPEPTTITLFVAGVIGLLCYAWRKRR